MEKLEKADAKLRHELNIKKTTTNEVTMKNEQLVKSIKKVAELTVEKKEMVATNKLLERELEKMKEWHVSQQQESKAAKTALQKQLLEGNFNCDYYYYYYYYY